MAPVTYEIPLSGWKRNEKTSVTVIACATLNPKQPECFHPSTKILQGNLAKLKKTYTQGVHMSEHV